MNTEKIIIPRYDQCFIFIFSTIILHYIFINNINNFFISKVIKLKTIIKGSVVSVG